MTILEFFKNLYRAFIAQFNSAPTTINSTLNDNVATENKSISDNNSHLPNQESSIESLRSYHKNHSRRWPPIVPSSWYQAGSSPVLGRVVFLFAQDIDELRSETPLDQIMGWTARLDLFTCDLPSLLRDGLFLTWDNVEEQENHVKYTRAEGIGFLYNRCYKVSSSIWSGNLNVCAKTVKPIANFRLHHLSPDNVVIATAANHESNSVYNYDIRYPDYQANFMFDDMPLNGLWPWPKKEEGAKGEETERQGTKEDEEVVKDEGGGDEGEKDAGGEEEEMDSFLTWGFEDPLLDSWRD